MPMRTFSPMIASTETSMSSPIMMLWFPLRVRTSIPAAPLLGRRCARGLKHSPRMGATSIGSLRRRLARRSLKPQLNQIRTWVRQGRTDAWIAHQLDVSVGDIRSFKREHELVPDDAPGNGDEGFTGAAVDEELDLRAEDDALVAAALEAEQEADAADEGAEEAADEDEDEDESDSDD